MCDGKMKGSVDSPFNFLVLTNVDSLAMCCVFCIDLHIELYRLQLFSKGFKFAVENI